ncbi:hypothetical protein DV738_g5127, partial [Chaetothyriales sp. CBS 135597]
MECDICNRKSGPKDGMLCPVCARAVLYGPRIDHARVLLEQQTASAEIAKAMSDHDTTTESRDLHAVWHREMAKTNCAALKTKITAHKSEITALRDQIAELKAQVTRSRSHNESKSTDLDAIKARLPSRQHSYLDNLAASSRRTSQALDTVSTRAISIKLPLCVETAKLLGLRRTREKVGDRVREQYWISGYVIPDLRSINNMPCSELTAVIAVFTHLLVQIAFYMGLQLPAEITLPHRNYPLGTINTPSASYVNGRKPFPGSGSMSLGSSTTTSKEDKRPRPLFVGTDDGAETVSQFAKKDPTAFSFFVEGMSLLAWDVAWLLQSQGLIANAQSWSDTCQIGRNLYSFIQASQNSAPTLWKKSSNKNHRTTPDLHHEQSPQPSSAASLGVRSHSFIHNFLPTSKSENTIPTYTLISDSLRRTLITERKDSEWEVLAQDEFNDGAERFDEAIVVKPRAAAGKDISDTRTMMTTKNKTEDPSANASRSKGTSGWTKVKSRDGIT